MVGSCTLMTAATLLDHSKNPAVIYYEIRKETMSEGQNTIVCTFNTKIPRISAFDIQDWIYNQLQVPENAVNMVQVVGTRRQVYINFAEIQCLQEALHSTNCE
jgi:hypothetical protein